MPSELPSPVLASNPLGSYADTRLDGEVDRLLDSIGALRSAASAQRVVLKPNWVNHANPLGHGPESLVTHTRVIESVANAIATRLPHGAQLSIADAPVQACNFEELLRVNGVREALARLRLAHPGVRFEVADWRLVRASSRFAWHATERVDSWDPARHELVDVGGQSFLEPISERADRFRVTCYAPSTMQVRHRSGVHQYLVARAALDADLLINLPKLKTHIKAGVTCALKNLVGINGHKEFLPHHVTGSPEHGGDSHRSDSRVRDRFERYYDFHFEHLASLPRPLISVLSRALNAADRVTARVDGSNFGSWPGNDTVWRMTLDLNHLLYAWAAHRPRQVFTLVDAVTVGVGNGPLRPEPAHLGLLLAGRNPATIDAMAATLLGFDPNALPTIRNALTHPASIFRAPHPVAAGLPNLKARRPLNWEQVAAPPGR